MGHADHDAYIAAAKDELRPLLVDVRAQLASALPDAEEVIKYDMPGFQIGGSIIVGYAAFAKQCGLYLPPAAIAAHASQIAEAGLEATKTGVKFSPKKPMPAELATSLAQAARKERGV